MKHTLIITLLAAILPNSAFAYDESLVTVFEHYCHKKTESPLVLDSAIYNKTNTNQTNYDAIRGQGDNGFVMTFDGHPFLVEWIGEACRVSTNGAFPNDVMKALATNHTLSLAHGDKTDFRRAHWFESNHALTRYAFTHDLSNSTVILEYQKDDATLIGPVSITMTK